jgi:hypothetical protein
MVLMEKLIFPDNKSKNNLKIEYYFYHKNEGLDCPRSQEIINSFSNIGSK